MDERDSGSGLHRLPIKWTWTNSSGAPSHVVWWEKERSFVLYTALPDASPLRKERPGDSEPGSEPKKV